MPARVGRRDFLKVLAGSAIASQIPSVAWAARPPLQLVFPQDPLVTWFEPTYGATKPDGRRHLGIDLMAPKLSPVYAIADGVVNRIAQSPRAGRYLIVDHNDGWQSWYLHLNNDSRRDNGRAGWGLTVVDGVDEGSAVVGGAQIAFVGDSGNAEGTLSHTHFELHLGTRTVNPYPYLIDGRRAALEKIDAERVQAAVAELCRFRETNPGVDTQMCPSDFVFVPRARPGLEEIL
jgi:murein DD-endopeptidase MepM/ murein hydrolase activator NlpD